MSFANNNIKDTYEDGKLLASEIIDRLSGNYFGARIFTDSLTLNAQKGMGQRFGEQIVIEKEVDTTYRTFTKGGTRQFDETPQILKKILTYDQSREVNINYDDYDKALYNDAFRDNYVRSASRTFAVGMEQDMVLRILNDSDIPVNNTISLSAFADKFSYDVVNEGIVKLGENGMTAGTRVRCVVDNRRAGQYRDSLVNFNVTGTQNNNQLISSVMVDSFGVEMFEVLNSGSFKRLPTQTTLAGVSGGSQIVGFMIAENTYQVNGVDLPTGMPGVNSFSVQNPNIPLSLRYVEGYDFDSKTNKFGWDILWGDVNLYPELVIPITL